MGLHVLRLRASVRKGSVLGGVTGVRRLDASGIGSVVSLAILGDHCRPLGWRVFEASRLRIQVLGQG